MVEKGRMEENEKPCSQRMSRNELTLFGKTYNDAQTKFGYKTSDLDGVDGVTRTDIEQISRMSRSVEAIRGMSPERLERIIDRTASAIRLKLQEKWEYMPVEQTFEDRLKERLLAAAKSDLEIIEQENLKNNVIEGMVRLTGRSLAQLAMDLDKRETTLKQLLERWGILDVTKTTGASGASTP